MSSIRSDYNENPKKAASRRYPTITTGNSVLWDDYELQELQANRRREAHKHTVALAVLHGPWPEGISEEIKLRGRIPPFATSVFAVHDLGLVRMHL